MIRIRKKLLIVTVTLGLLLLFVYSILRATWGEYGGHTIRIAVKKYVTANDGSWPASWADIEPYHCDPVFGVSSTFFVRQHWGVAWNIDPVELVRSSNSHTPDDKHPSDIRSRLCK